MKFVKSQQRKEFAQIRVTRVTQKVRKFAGQTEKQNVSALFALTSLSRNIGGTSLGRHGTGGTSGDKARDEMNKLVTGIFAIRIPRNLSHLRPNHAILVVWVHRTTYNFLFGNISNLRQGHTL
jgi:hypothetical protein